MKPTRLLNALLVLALLLSSASVTAGPVAGPRERYVQTADARIPPDSDAYWEQITAYGGARAAEALLPQGANTSATRVQASGPITFTKHIIATNFDGARSAYAADIDSDGDVDVLGAARDSNSVTWWENDGSENFAAHIIASDFTKASNVFCIDVDGDGDMDILGAAHESDDITWWENDGSENFTEHIIADHFDYARWVHAIDLDDDGDTDVLGAASNADDITWWENDGSENFTEHTIADSYDGARSVYATDVDGDGDVDVLGSAAFADDITWWENDGSEGFTEHTIAGNFNNAKSVYATDVDSDGDMDILGAAHESHDITWWKNDGSENFAEYTIDSYFGGANCVYATDIDGDGDVDVLGSASGVDTIAWWENDGSENFTKHTINRTFDGAQGAYATDIDGDGDVDVLGSAISADAIAWWEQAGSPPLQISPATLDFDATFTELTLSINPKNPGETWTLDESLPWLTLSDTGGTGPATVTASVDRSGLAEGDYDGTIDATVSGQAVTVNVTMRVILPEVTILAPSAGANARAGDTLLARALVQMGSTPLTGAQTEIAIPLGGPYVFNGNLYDDGQHEDGAEDDGIYAAPLALPARITMSPGPYTLVVTATSQGTAGADSVGFDVIGGYSGAPTVTLALDGSHTPDFIRDDLVTITATVTYPDASIHADSGVTATLVLPDFRHEQVNLINVDDDAWQGSYTLSQGGHYWVDVRVDPPLSTDFIDGYGGTQVHVYQGDLALAPTAFSGPYPLRGRVPLSLCVTSDGEPFKGATIHATVTGPNDYKRTVGSFNSPDPGYYEAVFSPRVSGQHVVTYTATAYPYRPATATLTLPVSTESSQLASRVRDFVDEAVLDANLTMDYIKEAAAAGEFFAEEQKTDSAKLVADLVSSIIFFSLEHFGSDALDGIAHTVQTHLPGSDTLLKSGLVKLTEDVFLAGLETGTSAALEATASHLLKGPAAFYAADGDAREMLSKFENQHAISVTIQEAVIEENGFQKHFVNTLEPVVEQAKSDITTNATNLAADLPPLTLAQEQAYIDDLYGRQEANWWLVPEAINYKSSPLYEAYERRSDTSALKSFLQWVVKFLVWEGGKTVAFAICDGPCAFGVKAGKIAVEALVNAQKLSEDGQMMNLGADVMHEGFWAMRCLWSNTLSGLDVISQGAPPDTPQGRIEGMDFIQEGLHDSQGYFWKTSAYVDVTIVNSGTVTAEFFPYAYGEYRDILKIADTLVDPAAPDTDLDTVELAPNETKTVRLMLYRTGQRCVDDEPEWGSTVLINLFARTGKGDYLVSGWTEFYKPDRATYYYAMRIAGTNQNVQARVQYLSGAPAVRAQANGESEDPVYNFPLTFNVGTNEGSSVYNVGVLAHNPLPRPMAVILSQTVPSGVEVIDVTDGVVSDGEIHWHKAVQPHESVRVGYRFRPMAGSYGDDIIMPPLNMSYYEAVNDVMVTLSTGAGQVSGKLPLFAHSVPPQQVAPDAQVIVSIEVNNLDTSQLHQGSLQLSLMDLAGTQVTSANNDVSLPAGSHQTYPLTFTAPDVKGTYVLKVTLTQDSTTTTVFTTFVQVREYQLYLPLVLRS